MYIAFCLYHLLHFSVLMIATAAAQRLAANSTAVPLSWAVFESCCAVAPSQVHYERLHVDLKKDILGCAERWTRTEKNV